MKNLYKKSIIFGLILLVGTSIFAQAIKFSAKDIDGKNVSEQVFADSKITMVNVWGTFCGPCIRAIPDLGVLNKKYGDDFQIVGIVIDAVNSKGLVNEKTVNSAKNIVKTTGANYRHIIPDAEGKQTDLFVSNSTHARKAKFFALRIILMKCVTWLMGNMQTKFVEDMLRYVPVLLLFYCEE